MNFKERKKKSYKKNKNHEKKIIKNKKNYKK
jgi:hypothetical protein